MWDIKLKLRDIDRQQLWWLPEGREWGVVDAKEGQIYGDRSDLTLGG